MDEWVEMEGEDGIPVCVVVEPDLDAVREIKDRTEAISRKLDEVVAMAQELRRMEVPVVVRVEER